MQQQVNNEWFTEICKEGGIALGFKLKDKLHEEITDFQKIEIYATEHFGNLMVIDGFIMLTSRDNFLYHEMLSHPALFTHQNPSQVVIIGGGDCGTLKEVLKHQEVAKLWQIEIDERVTRLAQAYFPELCDANDDSRANFYFGDGLKWMTQATAKSIDVIIVDSTDPIGPGEVLFTEAFYKDCFAALREGGIIVQQSESPLLHRDSIIAPMHKKMRAAGFTSTHTLQFPQPCYPSGWWTATMAGKNCNLQGFRQADVANKPFNTGYYNESIHLATLAVPELLLGI